jgi:transposase
MHLRVSTQKRKGKTYRYAQLVESYRRQDGTPATRVVKHLGPQTEEVIEAMRTAFKAVNSGDALVLASDVANEFGGTIAANLRYLDLAVLLECEKQWGLSTLLDALAQQNRSSIPFSKAVLPLIFQRCCAPRSKQAAVRWFPKTALPELLGVEIGAFNNSRIHRTLEILYNIDEALQHRLANKYLQHDQTFTTLFMDVTDTFFEGMGCDLAEQTRTKTEMPHKRCLAIVLLVNEQGYPLRWKVLGGKTKDWHAMKQMLDDIGQVPWLRDTPLIMDRAMGNQCTVADLKDSGVLFLTAAHINAIEQYTLKVPSEVFADVKLKGTEESYEEDIELVAQKAREAAGFEQLDKHLFAIELGVYEPACEMQTEEQPTLLARPGPVNHVADHLEQAQDIRQKMDKKPELNQGMIASSMGISKGRVSQLLALLRLAPAIQRCIQEAGTNFPLGEKRLRTLFELGPEQQLEQFEQMLKPYLRQMTEQDEASADSVGPLRMVAYFNPRLFVDIRRRTTGHLNDIQKSVCELNAELARAKQSRKYEPTLRKFTRQVERLHYFDVFDIKLEPIIVTSNAGGQIRSFRGSISLKPEGWARRRLYDGFVLLVGHPDLPHKAHELVNFYRHKDMVEKDFEIIKSLIKLRPIWHYTDPKVLAHVTVCMLSLLLERTLRIKLRNAGLAMSAQSCIEILSDCHLNQRKSGSGTPLYETTLLNSEQEEILDALNLRHLASDNAVRPRLMARSV